MSLRRVYAGDTTHSPKSTLSTMRNTFILNKIIWRSFCALSHPLTIMQWKILTTSSTAKNFNSKQIFIEFTKWRANSPAITPWGTNPTGSRWMSLPMSWWLMDDSLYYSIVYILISINDIVEERSWTQPTHNKNHTLSIQVQLLHHQPSIRTLHLAVDAKS